MVAKLAVSPEAHVHVRNESQAHVHVRNESPSSVRQLFFFYSLFQVTTRCMCGLEFYVFDSFFSYAFSELRTSVHTLRNGYRRAAI